MLVDRFRSDQQLIKRRICAGRFVGEVASHRREGHEDFIHVPAIVAGVLLLLRHHPNDGVGKIIQIDRVAHGIAPREQLLGRVGTKKRHAPGLTHVVPVIEASGADVEAANVAELRIRSGHRESCVVEIGVDAHRILLELGDGVFAVRRLGLDHRNVWIVPVHHAARVGAAGLQAGAAMKHNHHVFAEVSRLFFLAFAQAFSGSHHQHNRNDAPRDPEHRKKGAQLVRPQGSQHIENEITNRHVTTWTQPGTERHPQLTCS